jgi:hypothetical protein
MIHDTLQSINISEEIRYSVFVYMYSLAQKVYHLYLCIKPFFSPSQRQKGVTPAFSNINPHLQARRVMMDDTPYAESVPFGT